MTTQTGLAVTFPYADSSEPRYQCSECGGWERGIGCQIRHSKRCDSRPQPGREVVSARAAAPTADVLQNQRDADRLRREGLAGDMDRLAAVQRGFLSVSDAMNSDD